MIIEIYAMENVWTDLLVACLLCIVSSVYWYIFKDSTCPRVISTCFPGVTFLIGKEYALWQESNEHLIDWRSVLISVCACLSYAGFIASCILYADRRRLNRATVSEVVEISDDARLALILEDAPGVASAPVLYQGQEAR